MGWDVLVETQGMGRKVELYGSWRPIWADFIGSIDDHGSPAVLHMEPSLGT